MAQIVIMNELYTAGHNKKVVGALAMAFGGWVSGYFLTVVIVVVIWKSTAEGSGADALLIVS